VGRILKKLKGSLTEKKTRRKSGGWVGAIGNPMATEHLSGINGDAGERGKKTKWSKGWEANGRAGAGHTKFNGVTD